MTGRPPAMLDLVNVFRGHVAARPDAPAVAWFDRRCAIVAEHHNAGFLARCEGLAGALLAEGIRPGQPVLLLHPPDIAFFEAFFACLIAGIVPVPAYPPDPLGRGPRLDFVTRICARMGIEVALTTRRYDRARKLGNVRNLLGRAGGWPAVRWIASDRLKAGDRPPIRRPGPDDVALVQFTSGSTREPRGVRIAQRNLMHQVRVNSKMGGLSHTSRVVSWLPQYHDFGLVNAFLCALYAGCPVWLCSPLDFIAEPAIWLQMMHRVRATHSASPDFGYAYAVRRTTPDQRAAWDLSALECSASGGEAIRPGTVRAFAEAFAASGLRRSALYGGYGQAEHVVGMTGGTARIIRVDGERLRRDGRLVPVGEGHAHARELASSGRAFEGVELRIVERGDGRVLPEGHIGEIWARSESVAAGYVGEPVRTAQVFQNRLEGEGEGQWLRTGDLGALLDGDLFVTGRLKDLVIVRGRNVHPADVEDRIRDAALPGVRPGGVAVCGLEVHGAEALAAVVELRDARRDAAALDTLAEQIRAVVAEDGLHLARLQLVGKGAVPKTTSGKTQRARCAATLSEGKWIGDRAPLLDRSWAVPAPSADADDALADALHAARGLPDGRRTDAIRDALLTWIAAGTEGPAPDTQPTDETTLAALGLDSLRAVVVFDAVERALGVVPSRAALYELRTLGALVTWIAAPPADAVERAPLSLASPDRPVPATSFQRLIHRDHGNAPGFVMVLEVEGPLDERHVRQALAAALTRHDLLRAGFAVSADGLMLVPRAAPTGPDAVVLTDVDAAADAADADDVLLAALRAPFDLGCDPLLRVALQRGEPSRLGLALHHLLYDGISLHALLAELVEALAASVAGALDAGRPSPSFLALAAARDAGAPDRSWWREVLADVTWPVPVPQPVEPATRALVDAGEVVIEPAHVEALTALARRHHTSLDAVVAAGWAEAMGAALGVSTVVCGHPISLRDGRTRAVCGPLVNDVLLPLPAHTASSVGARIERIGQRLRGAQRHGDVPLAEQLALLPQRTEGPAACPVLYAFHDWDLMASQSGVGALRAGRAWTVGPLTLRRLPFDALGGPRPFDYFAVAERVGGRLTCSLRVEQTRVGADFGAAIVRGWSEALRAMADGGAAEGGA